MPIDGKFDIEIALPTTWTAGNLQGATKGLLDVLPCRLLDVVGDASDLQGLL